MLKHDLIKLIKDINLNQNANNIAKVDSIFTELKNKKLTIELFALVFTHEKPSYFLLRYYKYWIFFKYVDWLKLIEKLKSDHIGLRELITWMYKFFHVDIVSIVLEDKNIHIDVKNHIKDTLFYQGKLKIGVSPLMLFGLNDEDMIKFYGVSKKEIRKYGDNLVKQGATSRNNEREIIFTGNTEVKIPFESILNNVSEELKVKFYENPRFDNINLLNDILEEADKKLVIAFLDENPFIRKLLVEVNNKWIKEDTTPWFLKNLGSN